jgi:uncharacterized OB-fold protein
MSAPPSPVLADSSWPHRSVRCGDCGRVTILGALFCPACGGARLAATELTGKGRVEAVTTVAERYTPLDVPTLTVAMVRLDDGPLILARATPEVAIGAEVHLDLVETQAGEYVPQVIGPVP